MAHILAIDQSTSATKALLFDTAGVLVDKASLEHRQIYPKPGWVEHDAEEIWRNTLAVIAKLDRREVQSLSLTNQRETIVVFDRQSGKPLDNALVWQDRRGEDLCERLVRAGHDEMVARKTGLKIDTYFSASKLTWLIQNHRDLAEKLASGQALIGTIDTYLLYRLTSGEVFATDHTNASRTLLFDIANLKWEADLCRLFQVPIEALAQVRDSTAHFGRTDVTGLLPHAIPICGVMGDSHASLFAHRCFAPGSAKVTLGSGSSVLLNIGQPIRNGDGAAVSTIAWTHQGKPTYCFEGIVNYSAATIAWLKDQLGLIQSAEETEALAKAVPDNGGVYFVPAFSGLSAPYWSPSARAAIVGMTAHTNRSTIVRAALESIAYQLRDVLDAMKSRAQVELAAIHADGGATRNAFLMQFIADMLQIQVVAAQMPDCSALGAAMAGFLGMGIYQSIGDLNSLKYDSISFRPQMPAKQADKLHTGWKRAIDQVLSGAQREER